MTGGKLPFPARVRTLKVKTAVVQAPQLSTIRFREKQPKPTSTPPLPILGLPADEATQHSKVLAKQGRRQKKRAADKAAQPGSKRHQLVAQRDIRREKQRAKHWDQTVRQLTAKGLPTDHAQDRRYRVVSGLEDRRNRKVLQEFKGRRPYLHAASVTAARAELPFINKST